MKFFVAISLGDTKKKRKLLRCIIVQWTKVTKLITELIKSEQELKKSRSAKRKERTEICPVPKVPPYAEELLDPSSKLCLLLASEVDDEE